ncbi:MAG: hypothetical protein Q7S27_03480 [Nanoarchaeota archaeon]|nr:hypothetical protein [Nanoarchaeota archaeon]
MFFKKKNPRCDNCNSKVNQKFSFCPYCGISMLDEEKYMKDYGFLGKGEEMEESMIPPQLGMGITDKLIGSLMNNLMKSLDKQFKQMNKGYNGEEIKSFPNGIRIQIGSSQNSKKPNKSIFEKAVSEKQLEKMNSLPREKAETKIKRLSDKIVYELSTPGIESPQDVFVSRLESGYEIKAIGDKKIYVNSLPINLPLKSLSLDNNKLLIEFKTLHQ